MLYCNDVNAEDTFEDNGVVELFTITVKMDFDHNARKKFLYDANKKVICYYYISNDDTLSTRQFALKSNHTIEYCSYVEGPIKYIMRDGLIRERYLVEYKESEYFEYDSNRHLVKYTIRKQDNEDPFFVEWKDDVLSCVKSKNWRNEPIIFRVNQQDTCSVKHDAIDQFVHTIIPVHEEDLVFLYLGWFGKCPMASASYTCIEEERPCCPERRFFIDNTYSDSGILQSTTYRYYKSDLEDHYYYDWNLKNIDLLRQWVAE